MPRQGAVEQAGHDRCADGGVRVADGRVAEFDGGHPGQYRPAKGAAGEGESVTGSGPQVDATSERCSPSCANWKRGRRSWTKHWQD